MGYRRRRIFIAAIAAVSGVALGASLGSTMATWEDRGGATMKVTAIEEPLPPTAPVTPGTGTTFTGPTWSNMTPRQACFTVTITSESPTPVTWTVVMHTDQAPFHNTPPTAFFLGQIYGDPQSYTIAGADGYGTTNANVLVTPAFTSQWVSAGNPHNARVCTYNLPEPPWQPPGATTYTQRQPVQFIRNGSQPCVAGTVDGLNQFFVGFTIVFNWKDVLDAQLAAAAITQAEHDLWITFTHWDGAPPGYLASTGATGPDLEASLQGYSAESRTVSNAAPVTIASCAY